MTKKEVLAQLLETLGAGAVVREIQLPGLRVAGITRGQIKGAAKSLQMDILGGAWHPRDEQVIQVEDLSELSEVASTVMDPTSDLPEHVQTNMRNDRAKVLDAIKSMIAETGVSEIQG